MLSLFSFPFSFPSFPSSSLLSFLPFFFIPISLSVYFSSFLLSFLSIAFFTISPCFSHLYLISNSPAIPRWIIFFVSEEQGHLCFWFFLLTTKPTKIPLSSCGLCYGSQGSGNQKTLAKGSLALHFHRCHIGGKKALAWCCSQGPAPKRSIKCPAVTFRRWMDTA